ncbi:neuronal acetylcholine receptor subunit alpha-7-like [Centruroides sculpturatus]|uniref:neuronal acetylcholine receptor subunit alpha-7-like n=1 Tax=Centruroides sculpturatus TaxID=218467 RepID=UPI000C6ECAF6|nr:neuronal acetylcholine receptor subunit alpha-7-like [Centruroides sculpturatus]
MKTKNDQAKVDPLGVTKTDDGGLSNIQKLRKVLLSNYDKMTRPVLHHTNITHVEVTLRPFYISELFTNNSSCNFSSPTMDVDPFANTDVIVNNDGTVKWSPPATIRNICFLDYRDYPRDEQTCRVIFGSWSQHGFAINITLGEKIVDMKSFRNTNPHWELIDITSFQRTKYYSCCPEPYVTLEYTVKLKRRPTIEQQLEWVLSVAIVILTLAVFWLPPTSETKLTIGSINILTITGLLMYLASQTKSVSSLPYIARLLNFSLYTVTSAMILEIVVINMALVFGPCYPPEQIYDFISGTLGRFLLLEIAQPPSDDGKTSCRKQWLTVATMVDRVLFFIYLIVLLAIPKTG